MARKMSLRPAAFRDGKTNRAIKHNLLSKFMMRNCCERSSALMKPDISKLKFDILIFRTRLPLRFRLLFVDATVPRKGVRNSSVRIDEKVMQRNNFYTTQQVLVRLNTYPVEVILYQLIQPRFVSDIQQWWKLAENFYDITRSFLVQIFG